MSQDPTDPNQPRVPEHDDWSSVNRERGRLIDKRIAGTLSSDEEIRLEELNAYADEYLEKVVPRPTGMLDELEERLSTSPDHNHDLSSDEEVDELKREQDKMVERLTKDLLAKDFQLRNANAELSRALRLEREVSERLSDALYVAEVARAVDENHPVIVHLLATLDIVECSTTCPATRLFVRKSIEPERLASSWACATGSGDATVPTKTTRPSGESYVALPEHLDLGRVLYGTKCVRFDDDAPTTPSLNWSSLPSLEQVSWSYVACCVSSSPLAASVLASVLRKKYANNSAFNNAIA